MAEMLMNQQQGYDTNVSGMPFGTGSPGETAQQPAGLASLISGLYAGLGDTAKKAFGAAQLYTDTGQYDPSPVFNAAMLPMGTGAVAGVPLRGAETVLGAGPIRAYHGSPHDFDAFSLDKIGTGEGAQAYGHGLYFAENEGVAKGYRDQLANLKFGDKTMGIGDADWHLANPNPGKMYEVNINADPEHFLDWDKLLGQQSPQVQEALQEKFAYPFDPSKTGREWIDEAHSYARGNPATPTHEEAIARTAQRLHEAGVPGIKYLDQGSRGAQSTFRVQTDLLPEGNKYHVIDPNGQHKIATFDNRTDAEALARSKEEANTTRNYVVFNDKLIDILKKYGLAGAVASPAFGQVQNSPVFGSPKQDPMISALLGGT
jgi:hypothetical protein